LTDYWQSTSEPTAGIASRFSDLALAGLLVAIIALMILPLPTLVIDVLVALNIVIGVMLVLMGIYISSALQFSAFPSVILISTLFRLALSVATTRLILLHGDAGHIINTFGNMVVGGNLVVGLVVFLIITLVQFLVIAKGAERVAEVGARFSLDAMPGKQLSIDSDLRSGLLDKDEARAKRRELEHESKLHGSMDGAMKFVKGDAIAGIVIIIVNLLGGLAIGIWQLEMSAEAAVSKYSILTIGDGLVAQIPALLGAMAAGLIVTRSTDTKADRHLGDSIQKQFASIPRVMLVAGGICVLLAMVPGFPTSVFLGLALVLVLTGGLLVPAIRIRIERVTAPTFGKVLKATSTKSKPKRGKTVQPNKAVPVQKAVPLLLAVPASYVADGAGQKLHEQVTECLSQLQRDIGVPLPDVRIHADAQAVDTWELLAYEVPIHKGQVASLVDGDSGITEEFEDAIRQHATLFLGIQETSTLLQIAGDDYPDIVKETLRIIPLQSIAAILRYLVDENVSIRNLRAVFEALVEGAQTQREIEPLAEFVRIALARQTSHRYAASGKLSVLSLSPALEQELIESQQLTDGEGKVLPLPMATSERIREALLGAIDAYKPSAIVTNLVIRRQVWGLIKAQHFNLPVLYYKELMPTLDVTVLGQVNAEASPKLAEVSS